MATLEEAVELGRRWRYRHGTWREPAKKDDFVELSVGALLSSDFEIEPEPEKPREVIVCEHKNSVGGVMQHFAQIPSKGPCNCGEYGCASRLNGVHHVYHDADACERLHKNCDVPR